jgi:K+ transporter
MYGIAVATACFIDTIFFAFTIVFVFHQSLWVALLFGLGNKQCRQTVMLNHPHYLGFGLLDLVFISANLLKFTSGGWLVSATMALLTGALCVWQWGRKRMVGQRRVMYTKSYAEFFHPQSPELEHITMLPSGICFVYSPFLDCVPPALLHYVHCFPILQQFTVFVNIRPVRKVPVPTLFLFMSFNDYASILIFLSRCRQLSGITPSSSRKYAVTSTCIAA